MSVVTLVRPLPPVPRKQHARPPYMHPNRQLLWLTLTWLAVFFSLQQMYSGLGPTSRLLFFCFHCFFPVFLPFAFLFCFCSLLLCSCDAGRPCCNLGPWRHRCTVCRPYRRNEHKECQQRLRRVGVRGVGRVGVRATCFDTCSDCRTKSLESLEGAIYGFSWRIKLRFLLDPSSIRVRKCPYGNVRQLFLMRAAKIDRASPH